MALSWSLVIATLNREECLLRSLRANVSQSRPPSQVIVVDSSDDWQRTRDRVLAEVAVESPGVEWIYVGSAERSLTRQRNEGLALCACEIVFFLDDDSFMYRDCAAEILKLYEDDVAEQLGGVCAWLADGPEGARGVGTERPERLRRRAMKLIERQWHQERLFIPYDGRFHLKEGSFGSEAVPVPLFHGCRMTFRTAAVRKQGGFEEMLVGSACGEDCDFSYRVSRDKALVAAPRALLYHEQTPVERPKRELNTALVILNAIALYRVNQPRPVGAFNPAYTFLLRRALLELLRDCARPRRGMPHTRGALWAARLAPTVLSLEGEALRDEYVRIQAKLRARSNDDVRS